MTLTKRNPFWFLVVLLAMTLMAAFTLAGANARQATPEATPETPPTIREALVTGYPEAAPGQQLQLVRTIIQPGVTLPPHIHPGMQIAWIESGILHYVVVAGGEIPIRHANMEGSPEPAEMLGPGQETDLFPGDSVVETENVVHYGANLGDVPVVIWSATLLTEGAPIAEVVEIAATPTR